MPNSGHVQPYSDLHFHQPLAGPDFSLPLVDTIDTSFRCRRTPARRPQSLEMRARLAHGYFIHSSIRQRECVQTLMFPCRTLSDPDKGQARRISTTVRSHAQNRGAVLMGIVTWRVAENEDVDFPPRPKATIPNQKVGSRHLAERHKSVWREQF